MTLAFAHYLHIPLWEEFKQKEEFNMFEILCICFFIGMCWCGKIIFEVFGIALKLIKKLFSNIKQGLRDLLK